MDSLTLLRKCYLCAQLDDAELNEIGQISSIRTVKKGEILFLQGDKATGFYTLLSGKIRVYKASPEGKEYTLHLIRPGQMFAEVVIFHGEKYPANCSALEESMVAFFPKEQFLELLKSSPQISLKMIGGLSGFIREFNQMVEDLSLKDVPARLAAYLLREYRKNQGNNFSLEITKSELASKLGTISETLSRNLKKLKEIEAITVDGRAISILDPERLQAIAEGEKL